MLDVIQDKWSAVVSLTRYTRSAPAAILLVAAYFQQQQQGEGVYFPWGEKQIGAEVGIKRRTILTARRLLRQLKLIDWDASAGQRALYVVNTDLIAKVLGAAPNAPAKNLDCARSEPARIARTQPARIARTQPARIARGSTEDAPANPTNPARIARVPENDAPAEEASPARATLDAPEPPPAETPNPARNDPPRPPGTRYSSFSSTSTSTRYNLDSTKSPQSAPATDAAQPGATLLEVYKLTSKQICELAPRYTLEQIRSAIDFTKTRWQAGLLRSEVGFLVHILRNGTFPAARTTNPFDEPPSEPVRTLTHSNQSPGVSQEAPTPGKPYLPKLRPEQTFQDRSEQIGAYLDSLPPLPSAFFGFRTGSQRAIGAGERAALCTAQ